MRPCFVRSSVFPWLLGVPCSLALAGPAAAQVGTVASEAKISETAGGFGGVLDGGDSFGRSLCALGDLDGDGTQELAVGARADDDGSLDQGAVWILFLNADGTVASETKISETSGGFGGALDANDAFGTTVAPLGDLDGDGIEDLAVGAIGDDDGGGEQGAVWILFLEGDTIAPIITCPSDITEECTSPSGAVVTFAAPATDDHDPTPLVACVPPSGSTFAEGTTTVNCTATDDSGNSAMCSFDLTVEDTTPPTITCPADILKLTSLAGGGWFVSFSVGASDVCDPAPDVVCVPPSGSFFPLGTTLVTCTATDDSSNSSMCSFQVTIKPKTRPDGPAIVVLQTPVPSTAGPCGPRTGRVGIGPGSVESEPARLAVQEFGFLLAPQPLLLFEVKDAWVELSDGKETHLLYEPGDGARSMSVFVDLSVLFPLATPGTAFRLVAQHEGDGSRLDGLRFHGGASLRNGSDVNEVGFVSAGTPLAGEQWQAWVDVSAHPGARGSLVVVCDRALAGSPSPSGELLVDLVARKPLFTSLVSSGGATDVHRFSIPLGALGATVSLQALILDEQGSSLTNAIDLVVGRAP